MPDKEGGKEREEEEGLQELGRALAEGWGALGRRGRCCHFSLNGEDRVLHVLACNEKMIVTDGPGPLCRL